MTIRASLIAVTTLATAIALAACSGGGAGEPCCTATGQTESPTMGPAFVADGPLWAEPVILSTTQCVDLAQAFSVENAVVRSAGKATEVHLDGTYTVEIDKATGGQSNEGERITIRIFGGSLTEPIDRGIGSVPLRATIGATDPFRVAPINFNDITGRIGESTAELAAYCTLQTEGLLESMSLADVRAVMSREVVDGFVFDAGGKNAMRGRLPTYRHVINALVAVAATSGQLAQFEELREYAEAVVDSCKAASPIEAGMSCAPGADLHERAEGYRFWALLRFADRYGVTFGAPGKLDQHLQAAVQDFAEALYGNVLPSSPTEEAIRRSMLRQIRLLQYEVVERRLKRAITCYGDPAGDPDGDGLCAGPVTLTSGSPSFEQLFAALESTLHVAVLDTSNNAFGPFGSAIVREFGEVSTLDPSGTGPLSNLYNNSGIFNANSMQFQIDNALEWTNKVIRERLYEQTNSHPNPIISDDEGIYYRIGEDVKMQGAPIAGLSTTDKEYLTEILFYTSVNAVTIPQ